MGTTPADERRASVKRRITEALIDPSSAPFVVSTGIGVIIGGQHTGEWDWCWCQPTMVMHGCGHRHGEHRDRMD